MWKIPRFILLFIVIISVRYDTIWIINFFFPLHLSFKYTSFVASALFTMENFCSRLSNFHWMSSWFSNLQQNFQRFQRVYIKLNQMCFNSLMWDISFFPILSINKLEIVVNSFLINKFVQSKKLYVDMYFLDLLSLL